MRAILFLKHNKLKKQRNNEAANVLATGLSNQNISDVVQKRSQKWSYVHYFTLCPLLYWK